MEETTDATWRDKQASKPDPVVDAVVVWHTRLSQGCNERDAMADAIEAYESSLVIWHECDEPGCTKEAGCGWPVEGGGYRRTCWQHAYGMRK